MEQFLVQNKKQTEDLAKMLASEILKHKNNKKQALVFGFVVAKLYLELYIQHCSHYLEQLMVLVTA